MRLRARYPVIIGVSILTLLAACGSELSAPSSAEPSTAEPAPSEPEPTAQPGEPAPQPDDPCAQTITGEGPCEAYWPGFYFDPGQGRCVEGGSSGCSGHVPFRSMEACRERCEAEAAP